LKLEEEIKERLQGIGSHPISQSCIELDGEIEIMFRRYTEICEEGLKF